MIDMFGPGSNLGCAPLELRRLRLPQVEMSEHRTPPNRLGSQDTDASDAGCGLTDLLIQGLVERLPEPDTIWSLDERAKWLRTAASVFDLVYRDPERQRRAIGIAVASQDRALTSGTCGSDSETDLSA